IFGVMKCQWHILQIPPEYNMEIQALIPMALCTLHNFICEEDPEAFYQDYDADIPEIIHADDVNGAAHAHVVRGNNAWGELSDGPPNAAEKRRADTCRDEIAAAMWADYL
ncbi:hypothetical protein CY34DRAFT_47155, partial [Suillus luteus UH-Slu-Lm8-n1]